MKGMILIFGLLGVMILLISGCTDYDTGPGGEIPGTEIPEGTATQTETYGGTKETLSENYKTDGIISEGEYSNHKTLSEGLFDLYWTASGDTFYAGITGKSTGWVAIGFEPSSNMKDADIILGGVKSDGAYIYDMYSTGNFGPHPPDTELQGINNINNYEGTEKSGETTIEFSRKLNTGDPFDKVIKPGSGQKIIWALADSDEPSFKHNIKKGTATI
ncbi:hypothetical protein F1737_08590 [Methanoplanus sp. FWC-SCC4]|uniref:DOMON domain-containing protein n=1 Tax=Methanochimaera problematica TaxID=2609417 RepID=A0AA97FEE1_9EURY|nr:DOMON domain-containing protein [Methanoplanus sp. FWC-SCC4]WOF16743.1 hypothetical protein F1737_08590 [Methanoplanus sp. FWC-SCC4]